MGLTPAIMELTKTREGQCVKNAKGKGAGRGRRNPEPGDLSVSVFKEADVDFPGKYLEHFKRNGNGLKRQSERRPRQPSPWLGWMSGASSAECVESGKQPVRRWRDGEAGTRQGEQVQEAAGTRSQGWAVAPGEPPAQAPGWSGACLCFLSQWTPRWELCGLSFVAQAALGGAGGQPWSGVFRGHRSF